MKCGDCKYSKTKTQIADNGELMMDRFCYFNIPQVQLVQARAGFVQLVIRPKVEDDDFCSNFSKRKDTTANDVHDYFSRETEVPSSSSPTDSGGGSSIVFD